MKRILFGCKVDTAYTLLQEGAAKIGDEGLWRSFLENVPSHRELAAVWEKRMEDGEE